MLDKLDEIQARLAKATPGPWKLYFNRYVNTLYVTVPDDIVDAPAEQIIVCRQGDFAGKNNLDLIAHAPEDLAWACQEITKLKVQLHAAEAVLQQYGQHLPNCHLKIKHDESSFCLSSMEHSCTCGFTASQATRDMEFKDADPPRPPQ